MRSYVVTASAARQKTDCAIVGLHDGAPLAGAAAQLDAARVYPDRIVTTIEPSLPFHPAEGYHQNYAARNPAQPYVAAVALPKVEKLRRYFPSHLKG